MIDVHTSVCVTCDICGKQKTIEDERESIKNVKNQLKEEGWKFGKKEICPICNGKTDKYLFDSIYGYGPNASF